MSDAGVETALYPFNAHHDTASNGDDIADYDDDGSGASLFHLGGIDFPDALSDMLDIADGPSDMDDFGALLGGIPELDTAEYFVGGDDDAFELSGLGDVYEDSDSSIGSGEAEMNMDMDVSMGMDSLDYASEQLLSDGGLDSLGDDVFFDEPDFGMQSDEEPRIAAAHENVRPGVPDLNAVDLLGDDDIFGWEEFEGEYEFPEQLLNVRVDLFGEPWDPYRDGQWRNEWGIWDSDSDADPTWSDPKHDPDPDEYLYNYNLCDATALPATPIQLAGQHKVQWDSSPGIDGPALNSLGCVDGRIFIASASKILAYENGVQVEEKQMPALIKNLVSGHGPLGATLAVTCESGQVHILKTTPLDVVHTWKTNGYPAWGLSMHSGAVVASSNDMDICVFRPLDMEDASKQQSHAGFPCAHTAPQSLALESPDFHALPRAQNDVTPVDMPTPMDGGEGEGGLSGNDRVMPRSPSSPFRVFRGHKAKLPACCGWDDYVLSTGLDGAIALWRYDKATPVISRCEPTSLWAIGRIPKYECEVYRGKCAIGNFPGRGVDFGDVPASIVRDDVLPYLTELELLFVARVKSHWVNFTDAEMSSRNRRESVFLTITEGAIMLLSSQLIVLQKICPRDGSYTFTFGVLSGSHRNRVFIARKRKCPLQVTLFRLFNSRSVGMRVDPMLDFPASYGICVSDDTLYGLTPAGTLWRADLAAVSWKAASLPRISRKLYTIGERLHPIPLTTLRAATFRAFTCTLYMCRDMCTTGGQTCAAFDVVARSRF